MLATIQGILAHTCALLPDRPLVVGVSGGPDSLCLLHLLHSSGYPLVVACLDHGLRPESVSEMKQVQQVAADLHVPFVSQTVDTNLYASQHGLSVEAAARQLRYNFLFTQAARIDAQAVAVAHTADDQAETVLMHLLRGSGLAGLKGMEFRSMHPSWSTEIPLVRPLLTTWRSQVLEYCQQNGLVPVYDATNQSLDYFRNRVRLEILPYLAHYQPNIAQHLVGMAGTLALDHELLQSLVKSAWEACVVDLGQGYVAFQKGKLIEQPVALQRHLLRKAMLQLRTAMQDIELASIERGRLCLENQVGYRTCDLGAGLQLFLEQEIAWVMVRGAELPSGLWPAVLPDRVVELPIPGDLALQDGWVLQTRLLAVDEIAYLTIQQDQDPYHAWFDAQMIAPPLQVRHRLPGDRMQPAGMDGRSVKLSDLMINHKLPHRSRLTWPIVCAEGEIIWVPGCRQSHIARPGESTRQLLQLTLVRFSAIGKGN